MSDYDLKAHSFPPALIVKSVFSGQQLTMDTCATESESRSSLTSSPPEPSTGALSALSGITSILEEREVRYGGFRYNAKISQDVKLALRKGRQWEALTPEMKEALEMIANKLCRIVAGKAAYKDSWDDIAGYATLVSRELEENNAK